MRMDRSIGQETAITRARYDRLAPVYDRMEAFMERSVFGGLRTQFWAHVAAGRVLEVGVGTGKNMPYYPAGAEMTAIDFSDRMLARARRKAQALSVQVDLRQMDVQQLDFPEHMFNMAVATFVFCSVPLPIRGLQEMARVVRPGGDIWLLEHVRIDKPLIGTIMDLVNPLIVPLMGANINRRTIDNIKCAGLNLVSVENVRGDIVKLIHVQA